MLQKVNLLDSVPKAEETVLTTEVPTKESRLYTLLVLNVTVSGHGYRAATYIPSIPLRP